MITLALLLTLADGNTNTHTNSKNPSSSTTTSRTLLRAKYRYRIDKKRRPFLFYFGVMKDLVSSVRLFCRNRWKGIRFVTIKKVAIHFCVDIIYSWYIKKPQKMFKTMNSRSVFRLTVTVTAFLVICVTSVTHAASASHRRGNFVMLWSYVVFHCQYFIISFFAIYF